MRSEFHLSESTRKPLNVFVCSPLGQGGKGGIDRLVDATLAGVERNTDVNVVRLTTRGKHLAASLISLPLAIARISIGRMTGRAGIVHIHLASYGSTYRKILLSAACRSLGLTYLIHLHGAEFREFWGKCGKIRRAMIRAMLANAARIIVLGTPWAEFISTIAPETADRITILPNATQLHHPHKTSRADDTVHILFIGQLGARKGTPQLVSALTKLRDLPGWRCTIAGDGYIEATREAVAAAGLADRIDVPGWMDAESTERLLKEADVLTLPSFAENLPMSVIEGMAHGLAVVTTPVGAVEDIIRDGDTGLLVQPGDAEALSAALHKVIIDKTLRDKIGANARAFQQQRLSLPKHVERLTEIWREVAREQSPDNLSQAVQADPQEAPRRL